MCGEVENFTTRQLLWSLPNSLLKIIKIGWTGSLLKSSKVGAFFLNHSVDSYSQSRLINQFSVLEQDHNSSQHVVFQVCSLTNMTVSAFDKWTECRVIVFRWICLYFRFSMLRMIHNFILLYCVLIIIFLYIFYYK